jgi:hypothetical protein
MAGARFMAGRVAYYNEQKKYGFLQPLGGGEQLFFHIRDGRKFVAAEGTVKFAPASQVDPHDVAGACALRVVEPKLGDNLVFSGWEKLGGCGKARVFRWGFASDLAEVLAQIDAATRQLIGTKR